MPKKFQPFLTAYLASKFSGPPHILLFFNINDVPFIKCEVIIFLGLPRIKGLGLQTLWGSLTLCRINGIISSFLHLREPQKWREKYQSIQTSYEQSL